MDDPDDGTARGAPDSTARIRPADLARRQNLEVVYRPDPEAAAALAAELGLSGLRKARLSARLSPSGRSDWDLDGHLGATVTQPCIATIVPVTTRIDEPVARRFRSDAPSFGDLPPGEVRMPEDDAIEPLPGVIDLAAIFAEALALAIPAFPRADDAPLERTTFTEPGGTPLTEDDVKPFGGLADLRRRLDGKQG